MVNKEHIGGFGNGQHVKGLALIALLEEIRLEKLELRGRKILGPIQKQLLVQIINNAGIGCEKIGQGSIAGSFSG